MRMSRNATHSCMERTRSVNGLALQGGGAYAAFTAGALKAMFSAERGLLRPAAIRSISGTSGGALNALLLGVGIHE